MFKEVPYFPLKIKERDQNLSFYDPIGQRHFSVNYDAYLILKLCNGFNTIGEITKSIVKEFGLSHSEAKDSLCQILNPLTENGLVWWRDERMQWFNTPPPQSVFFELTYECNLRCLHCVNSSNPGLKCSIRKEDCLRILDELASIGVKSIAFSGGEPLLHKNFFEIAEFALEKGLGLQLSTNGTLIDERVAKKIKELNFDVQVSLDGSSPQVHNVFRGRKHAYNQTIQGITILLKNGVPLTVGTVATTLNFNDIPNIIKLITELGVSRFRLIPFIPCGRGSLNRELEINPLQMRDLTAYLFKRREKKDIEIIHMEFEETLSAPPNYCIDLLSWRCCSGAVAYCTITPELEVLPCSFFSGVDSENLRNHSFCWVWRNSRFLNYFRSISVSDINGFCQKCEWLPVCKSGCRASNFTHGNIFDSNRHCWVAHEMYFDKKNTPMVAQKFAT